MASNQFKMFHLSNLFLCLSKEHQSNMQYFKTNTDSMGAKFKPTALSPTT